MARRLNVLALLNGVDELWPSSQFTAEALASPAAEADKPLQVLTVAVKIKEPDRICNATAHVDIIQRHGLRAEAMLFAYGFVQSFTAIHKNPKGVLEAFQRDFPLPHLPVTFGHECTSHALSAKVTLLIKTFSPPPCVSMPNGSGCRPVLRKIPELS